MNGFEIKFPEGSLLKGKEEQFQQAFLRKYTSEREEFGREHNTFKMIMPDHLGGAVIEYKKRYNHGPGGGITGLEIISETYPKPNQAAA